MQTVAESINAAFWDGLNAEIASLPNDCTVGEAVVKFLNDIQDVCIKVYASDGGAVESDNAARFKAVAYRQVRVWYFG